MFNNFPESIIKVERQIKDFIEVRYSKYKYQIKQNVQVYLHKNAVIDYYYYKYLVVVYSEGKEMFKSAESPVVTVLLRPPALLLNMTTEFGRPLYGS